MQSKVRFRSFHATLAFAALAALAACSDSVTSPDVTAVDKKQPKQPPVADTSTTAPSTSTRTARFFAGAYLGDANSTPSTIAGAIRSFGTSGFASVNPNVANTGFKAAPHFVYPALFG